MPDEKKPAAAAKAKADEPKFKVCGNKNHDYFVHGEMDENMNAVRGELTCQLPEGHDSDHYAKTDATGKVVINGWWK